MCSPNEDQALIFAAKKKKMPALLKNELVIIIVKTHLKFDVFDHIWLLILYTNGCETEKIVA